MATVVWCKAGKQTSKQKDLKSTSPFSLQVVVCIRSRNSNKQSAITVSLFDHSGKAFDHSAKVFDHSGKAFDHSGKAYDHSGKAFDHRGKALTTAVKR